MVNRGKFLSYYLRTLPVYVVLTILLTPPLLKEYRILETLIMISCIFVCGAIGTYLGIITMERRKR